MPDPVTGPGEDMSKRRVGLLAPHNPWGPGSDQRTTSTPQLPREGRPESPDGLPQPLSPDHRPGPQGFPLRAASAGLDRPPDPGSAKSQTRRARTRHPNTHLPAHTAQSSSSPRSAR